MRMPRPLPLWLGLLCPPRPRRRPRPPSPIGPGRRRPRPRPPPTAPAPPDDRRARRRRTRPTDRRGVRRPVASLPVLRAIHGPRGPRRPPGLIGAVSRHEPGRRSSERATRPTAVGAAERVPRDRVRRAPGRGLRPRRGHRDDPDLRAIPVPPRGAGRRRRRPLLDGLTVWYHPQRDAPPQLISLEGRRLREREYELAVAADLPRPA